MDQSQLMEKLGFTASDLEANRQGHLTESQRSRLGAGRSRELIGLTARVVLYGLIAFTSIAVLFLGWRWVYQIQPLLQWNGSLDGPAILITVIGIGVLLLILWGRYRSSRLVNLDLAAGAVCTTYGPVRLRRIEAHYRLLKVGLASSTLVVNGLELPLSFDSSEAFVEGHLYRVYYLPQSRILLSAERMTP